VEQRIDQRDGLSDLPRFLERLLSVGDRGLRMTGQPQRPRPIAQDCHRDVLAKSCRHRTMLDRVVKRDPKIEVCPAFRDVARAQQGSADEAMPDHERSGRPLFFGKRKELRYETLSG
jgi:hypothetical protein